jgi:hypothetical protein
MTDPESRLKKFTPAGPNRDELLFAAGRAAVRPPTRWKWLTAFLAVSQTVTLVVWLWPKPAPVVEPVPTLAPVVMPTPDPVPEPPSPSQPEPYSYLALMYRDPDPEPRERFVPEPARQPPPLTAGSRRFD